MNLELQEGFITGWRGGDSGGGYGFICPQTGRGPELFFRLEDVIVR